eukprot:1851206-Lingulodinium_polyedra.AAC.1
MSRPCIGRALRVFLGMCRARFDARRVAFALVSEHVCRRVYAGVSHQRAARGNAVVRERAEWTH